MEKKATLPPFPQNSSSLLDYAFMTEIEEQHVLEP